jgi:putative peptide zinc metalloprotease protein
VYSRSETVNPISAGSTQTAAPGTAVAAVSQAKQPAGGAAFPAHPKLAAVKLAGQMRESAFENPPWLLEREGSGYVQVTELLYRIAEQCTGSNSVEDIAAKISSDGKPVSPATVRALIEKMLIPRGLVEAADGSVAAAATASPSPLALNLRMKMVRPEVVRPITAVLKVLYWPPILIAVLVAAAIAQYWMYGVHGVGSSVHDALYAPGLIFVILSVVVLSAGFHELGHAAALHYGGGEIKGMGAGMYTVYPAFYTDVSDNYRLPRWSRVRTDLGGFYFNLIFALGVMGLYVLTGHEFLLLIVVMVNLEIVHQLLPFLRLDGYWTLADITGVPDFFSQTGAFLRSILPIPAWKGSTLPPMKWWGKAVFGLYILISFPLLAFLFLVMVKSLPRVLATAWDSFQQQAQAFGQAHAQADLLGMASAGVQIPLLAVPVLGLIYTLYALGRRSLVAGWNWSRPTPARRVTGGLGLLLVTGTLTALWAPQLPIGGQPGPMYGQTNFEPIRPNERGTIPDAVAGVVSTREPTPASTPASTVTPSATSAPVRETPPRPGSAASPAGSPAATPAPTGVSTVLPAIPPPREGREDEPAPQPTARTTPAVVGTPQVSSTRTPTPSRTGTPTRTPTPVR